jgi:Protein of unknown function (DUF3303)
MLYMVVERFKNRDAVAVYRRVRDRGRAMTDGIGYVSSWVETNWDRCFQLMEADDVRDFEPWIASWADLVEFEIVPVITSAEARERIAPML